MIKSLDEGVDRVLAHLKTIGAEQNTIVMLLGDNGGYIGIDKRSGQKVPVTNNAPLRSGKGSCYEGGIRVPLLIRWPGVTKAGSVCHEPVVVMDLMTTLLAACGVSPKGEGPLDGMDLKPLLLDPSAQLKRDMMFWHYPHYYETTTPVSAVRARDWKLLEYYEDQHVELFNLKDDPGEKTDLAAKEPAKAAELRKQLHDWRKSVGAVDPKVNPDYKEKVRK
jgi:arylsulfatase A-like enzyme